MQKGIKEFIFSLSVIVISEEVIRRNKGLLNQHCTVALLKLHQKLRNKPNLLRRDWTTLFERVKHQLAFIPAFNGFSDGLHLIQHCTTGSSADQDFSVVVQCHEVHVAQREFERFSSQSVSSLLTRPGAWGCDRDAHDSQDDQ